METDRGDAAAATWKFGGARPRYDSYDAGRYAAAAPPPPPPPPPRRSNALHQSLEATADLRARIAALELTVQQSQAEESFRRADVPLMNRGDAAAATWT